MDLTNKAQAYRGGFYGTCAFRLKIQKTPDTQGYLEKRSKKGYEEQRLHSNCMI
ncbi:hypothetical protein J15TS10_19070 [Paenibacillus woosongensis]|uniref:Uncharacterized protein n=2 Tax=Paenibacillus woosongensis TaxID=307580 RepID=A0ABQ4MQ51_9BACL|nr:hypothetical protein J15TS10_19070 [Paenibacillus woosongensis]